MSPSLQLNVKGVNIIGAISYALGYIAIKCYYLIRLRSLSISRNKQLRVKLKLTVLKPPQVPVHYLCSGV